ncbi:Glycosyl hydrolases family 32 N-terminal domain [Comamonas thiooxydans]|nr:Glycosyl hydrolases family 32 N-terminal domain [Comamonas thiooxydans]
MRTTQKSKYASGAMLITIVCGFNWTMQHNDCLWRKECWHEAKTADLLHWKSKEPHFVPKQSFPNNRYQSDLAAQFTYLGLLCLPP